MIEKAIIEKTNLHPRNQFRFSYDFDLLCVEFPELKQYVSVNEFGNQSIDFSDPKAVKALNKALLVSQYEINNWDIPDNYLCPPIPGRTDYIHYIADLLATCNEGIIPEGESVIGLDIGVGANCIYPIIGNSIYGWSFIGSDIDDLAIENCVKIIKDNPRFQDSISLQLQLNNRHVFKNIIEREDRFSFTICNPPFHNSEDEAIKGSSRKAKNLDYKKSTHPVLNFGGQEAELWCEGGELGFITQMIYESAKYPLQCLWFTTLVSKKSNLASLYKTLNKVNVVTIKTIEMSQGQKNSRILAWTFLSESQQKNWKF